jgi:hypothetical protein
MDADARAQRSVDSLLPDVQVILDKMRAFHVPPDAPLRQRLLSWQTLLTGKPATFEISDDQFRQVDVLYTILIVGFGSMFRVKISINPCFRNLSLVHRVPLTLTLQVRLLPRLTCSYITTCV